MLVRKFYYGLRVFFVCIAVHSNVRKIRKGGSKEKYVWGNEFCFRRKKRKERETYFFYFF